MYVNSGSWGNMYETAKLTNSGGANGDALGISVAMDAAGTTIAAGAMYANTGASASGGVYIFGTSTSWSSWSQTARLGSTTANAHIGTRMTISADGSVIAAGSDNAKIYLREEGSGWADATDSFITLEPASADSGFSSGQSCLASDGTFLIGASWTDNATTAPIFEQTSSWSQALSADGSLSSSDLVNGDFFGHSTAVDAGKNIILVSAYGQNTRTGAVYLFLKPSSGWAQRPLLLPLNSPGAMSPERALRRLRCDQRGRQDHRHQRQGRQRQLFRRGCGVHIRVDSLLSIIERCSEPRSIRGSFM